MTIREKVFNKYKGHCAYCGCELTIKQMKIDHFESNFQSKYNKKEINNSFENLMPSCRMCNFYKNYKDIETFREDLETLLERVNKPFIYRLAKKYDLVEERKKQITFYFEKEVEE